MEKRVLRLTALMLCLMLALFGPALAEQPKEFLDAPAGVEVYGLTVGEEVRMGAALARLARSISAQFDTTDFGIRGADALLDGEELSVLEMLDPVEQVLAVLIVTGYADEAYAAVAELELTVSEAAQALAAHVYARCGAMDASARSKYAAAAEGCVSSDGEGAQITLRIGEQLTRCSFRREGETWMLDGVAIAQ